MQNSGTPWRGFHPYFRQILNLVIAEGKGRQGCAYWTVGCPKGWNRWVGGLVLIGLGSQSDLVMSMNVIVYLFLLRFLTSLKAFHFVTCFWCTSYHGCSVQKSPLMLPAVPDSCSVTGLKTLLNYEKTEVDRPPKNGFRRFSGFVVIWATCSSHTRSRKIWIQSSLLYFSVPATLHPTRWNLGICFPRPTSFWLCPHLHLEVAEANDGESPAGQQGSLRSEEPQEWPQGFGIQFCLFSTGVPSLRHPFRGHPLRVWKLSLFS